MVLPLLAAAAAVGAKKAYNIHAERAEKAQKNAEEQTRLANIAKNAARKEGASPAARLKAMKEAADAAAKAAEAQKEAIKAAANAKKAAAIQNKQAIQLGRQALQYQNTQKRAANMAALNRRKAKLDAIYRLTNAEINAIINKNTSRFLANATKTNAQKLNKLLSYNNLYTNNEQYKQNYARAYLNRTKRRLSRRQGGFGAGFTGRMTNRFAQAKGAWKGSSRFAALKSRIGGFFSGAGRVTAGQIYKKVTPNIVAQVEKTFNAYNKAKNAPNKKLINKVILRRNPKTGVWNFSTNKNRNQYTIINANKNTPYVFLRLAQIPATPVV